MSTAKENSVVVKGISFEKNSFKTVSKQGGHMEATGNNNIKESSLYRSKMFDEINCLGINYSQDDQLHSKE